MEQEIQMQLRNLRLEINQKLELNYEWILSQIKSENKEPSYEEILFTHSDLLNG
jgi:hypothetical protein